ncbi:MAG: LacI family transcriptional regulator [Chloroflexi bacterium]|nr:LacI family transcriptional regulator [Chloroflexota bacterium]
MQEQRRRRPTLREVAERAGVSLGTASYVFTLKGSVSQRTRRAVEQAASELGYLPHPRLNVTHTRQIRAIAVVSQRIALSAGINPFYSPVLHGVQRACAAAGATIVPTFLDRETLQDVLPRSVRRKDILGLIVLSYTHPEMLAALEQLDLPIVLIDHFVEHPRIDSVMADDEQGGYLATRLLIERCDLRSAPAMIAGPAHVSIQRRYAGYRRALSQFNLLASERVIRGNLDPQSGYAAMKELLSSSSPPAGVFCCNDISALGALNALYERGARVPTDCALVGFDDIDYAAHSVPPLTTIRVEKEVLGSEAVRYLLDRIERPNLPARYTRVAVSVVERRTVPSQPVDTATVAPAAPHG